MNEENINFFGRFLAILNDEELIRYERRFEMRSDAIMAAVIRDEIEERNLIQGQQ